MLTCSESPSGGVPVELLSSLPRKKKTQKRQSHFLALSFVIIMHPNSASALLVGTETKMCLTYIEEVLKKKENCYDLLCLMCLYSLTNAGLPGKALQFLKTQILQNYGCTYTFVIENLKKIGMLKAQSRIPSSLASWEQIRDTWNLIEEVDEKNPDDISYVYSGYAPLSCRLIESAMKIPTPFVVTEYMEILKMGIQHVPNIFRGWDNAIDSNLALLPGGPAFCTIQLPTTDLSHAPPTDVRKSKVTLVFFVGGCTRAEIACCRFLSRKNPSNQLVVGTTKIVTGRTLFQSFNNLAQKDVA
eukprot:TRINITY_DN7601_c0_g1_i3.p1 TRINITY_DN7601_c0_g1~~TRINITY_DN7601_c0_g1_i3.p1  ORF type:complete len:301 (-),score=67.60 TRINITY_DN7601_c0_g1_i3:103-1005(-)